MLNAIKSASGGKKLTHLCKDGKVRMVDVSSKSVTLRYACAEAVVKMASGTVGKIKKTEIKKGDVLAVAKLAAIMSAKNTSGIIPLTHPIKLTHCDVKFLFTKNSIKIKSEVKATDTTGCEMEAMVMAVVAGLTIYDMVKAVDRKVEITGVRLLEKRGGKSGSWRNARK